MNHLNVRFEVKATGPRKFEGYGSVFGNVDLGGDVVLPGAFAKSVSRHKSDGTMPLMFWMHQADQVPGVWTDMAEDKRGLWVAGELVDTALGRDVGTLLTKNAVRGLSMGYHPVDTGWRDDVRLLKEVDLFEVSIVSMAMNPLARVENLKAARLSRDGEYVPTEREIEQIFRKAGCSRNVARSLIARLFEGVDDGGMPGSHQWDAGADDEEKAALEAAARLMDRYGAAALQRY